jgi:hypothetical protein
MNAHPLAALASLGDWLHAVAWGGVVQTAYQVLYVAGPFALLGLLLHYLEAFSQGRLARRFGWKSVLWTGWLGTPIHELGHAAMCVLFRHRIRRIVLFEPDPASGRLGYVAHTYDSKSPYQMIGNFFIGTAPLAGGALALYGLLWLFEPEAARRAADAGRIAPAVAGGNLVAAAKGLACVTIDVLASVVTIEHMTALPFWLFLYLVLCIGSHLAPSPADYRGAWVGGLVLLGVMLLFNVLYLAMGGRPGAVTAALASVLGPALALFVLAAALCSLSALAVAAITAGRK